MADPTRREFLAQTGSCAAHLALAALLLPPALRRRWASRTAGPVVAAEPFARIEQVGPDLWAVISTPLSGDYTTVCNGGILAGRNAVLVIEGFQQPAGAAWVASQAKALTGRWPTHVLVTHYHSDHANGVAGYRQEGRAPELRATDRTRGLVLDRNRPADPDRSAALADATLVDPSSPSRLDLGGRAVTVMPSSGHTPSDLYVRVDDPNLVFAGDLVWNGMFPNYVDAIPTTLARSVAALRQPPSPVYVPGHGAVATPGDLDRYADLLSEVERAAREAHGRGVSAAEGAAAYALPASLGEWYLFNKRFIEVAFTAWYRELGG